MHKGRWLEGDKTLADYTNSLVMDKSPSVAKDGLYAKELSKRPMSSAEAPKSTEEDTKIDKSDEAFGRGKSFAHEDDAQASQQAGSSWNHESGAVNPSTGDWESHKATILDLYIKDIDNIQEVMSMMRDRGLIASPKAFEQKMKEWGLRKVTREGCYNTTSPQAFDHQNATLEPLAFPDDEGSSIYRMAAMGVPFLDGPLPPSMLDHAHDLEAEEITLFDERVSIEESKADSMVCNDGHDSDVESPPLSTGYSISSTRIIVPWGEIRSDQVPLEVMTGSERHHTRVDDRHDDLLEETSEMGSALGSTLTSVFDADSRGNATSYSEALTSHLASEAKMRELPSGQLSDQQPGQLSFASQLALAATRGSAEAKVATHLDDYAWDTQTIFSVASDDDDTRPQYLNAFANQLAEDAIGNPNAALFHVMSPHILDRILQTFSRLLHGESKNPFQWEISVILNKKRKEIRDQCTSNLQTDHRNEESASDDNNDDEATGKKDAKMQSSVEDWLKGLQPDSEADTSRFANYQAFVQNSRAYQWLVRQVQTYQSSTRENASIMETLGKSVQSLFMRHTRCRAMSRAKPASSVKLKVSIPSWGLSTYIASYRELNPEAESLDSIISLTGSWAEAQGMTVVEYLRQTWPETYGPVYSLLHKLFLAHGDGEACLYDGTQASQTTSEVTVVEANLSQLTVASNATEGTSFIVEGNVHLVSEIVEQLGWLSCALRRGLRLCAVHPKIQKLEISTSEIPNGPIAGSCEIVVEEVDSSASQIEKPGQCWIPLFAGGMLICGYPILRRPVPNTGLEISLTVMSLLVDSRLLVQMGQHILMKGFSSLFTATKVESGTVLWHFLTTNNDEKRLSYTDDELQTLKSDNNLTLRQLEYSRHIVGWCENATSLCGLPTASYDIRPSGMHLAPASIIIDRLYLEAGADTVFGINAVFNKKAKPLRLSRESTYPQLLGWAFKQSIIFHDVGECRAWLVDGASAVLHLAQSFIHRATNDDESPFDWVFNPEELEQPANDLSARQKAVQILRSSVNLELPLYRLRNEIHGGVSTPRYYTFGALIEEILHSLEILIDAQVMQPFDDGITIPQTVNPRRAIVGYDMVDVIDTDTRITLRVKHINALGSGWYDLARSLNSLILFGRGFGDLIKPSDSNSECMVRTKMPLNQDFLGVSTSTLQSLYQRRLLRDEPALSSGQLTKHITWLSRGGPMQPCPCVKGKAIANSSTLDACSLAAPVQILMKSTWKQALGLYRGYEPVDLMTLIDQGAVMFGHRAAIPLSRKSTTGQAIVKQDTSSAGSQTKSLDATTQQSSAPSINFSQSTNIAYPTAGSADSQTSLPTSSGKGLRTRFKNMIRRPK